MRRHREGWAGVGAADLCVRAAPVLLALEDLAGPAFLPPRYQVVVVQDLGQGVGTGLAASHRAGLRRLPHVDLSHD